MQRRSTGQLYLDGKLQPGQGFEAAPQQQYSEQQYVASAAHAGSNGALHRQLGAVLTQHAQHDAASPTYSSGDEERGAGTKARAGARPATPLTPASLRRNSRLALLSMLLLVFQGTALSIMLRYSRARAGQPYLASVSGAPGGGRGSSCLPVVLLLLTALQVARLPQAAPAYPPSDIPPHPTLPSPSAVILTEAIKLAICLAMQYRVVVSEVAAAGGGKPGAAAAARGALGRELRRQARDIAAKALPMLLPAGMFVMQQVRRVAGEFAGWVAGRRSLLWRLRLLLAAAGCHGPHCAAIPPLPATISSPIYSPHRPCLLLCFRRRRCCW